MRLDVALFRTSTSIAALLISTWLLPAPAGAQVPDAEDIALEAVPDPFDLGLINTTCVQITGTPGDDIINGTPSCDLIGSGSGDDTVAALGGPDDVSLSYGTDNADGAHNRDDIVGGPGVDIILGGQMGDTLSGGDGSDSLRGQSGRDDLMDSNPGDMDLICGDSGFDTISIQDGEANDKAYVNSGSGTISKDSGSGDKAFGSTTPCAADQEAN